MVIGLMCIRFTSIDSTKGIKSYFPGLIYQSINDKYKSHIPAKQIWQLLPRSTIYCVTLIAERRVNLAIVFISFQKGPSRGSADKFIRNEFEQLSAAKLPRSADDDHGRTS